MILDREAARALFENPEPAPQGSPRPRVKPEVAPLKATPPREETPFVAPISARKPARNGIDWRLVAPLGVAALCAGAVALFAIPRDPAEPGRTVAASSDLIAPPVTPPLPIEPEPVIPTTPLAAATQVPPVVALAETPRPAVRAAPSRQLAQRSERAAPRPSAPSAVDTAADASATAPALPPPSLGAPAPVILSPQTVAPPTVATTPPIVAPTDPQ